MKKLFSYLTLFEKWLWGGSVALIVIAFLLFDRTSYLSLIASVIGVSALIFCAKGNPIGQALIVVFSLLYGIISYSCAYYGEMITYLGMSAPMALFALISWLKNPYKGKKSEVKVNSVSAREIAFALFLTAVVTVIFYFVLKYFGTANLLVSTISVTTSFFAVYLTARRSPLYAAAYGLNDVVLIILWLLAAVNEPSYTCVVACFVVFLANDVYGFISWLKMQKRQECK